MPQFKSPQLGALGVSFTLLRITQFITLGGIIGLTANFINLIVTGERQPPDVLVATLVVASTAALYTVISYVLYYDSLLPLLVATGLDAAILVASIVVAVVIGKPLSVLNCAVLPDAADSSPSGFFSSVESAVKGAVQKAVSYFTFVAVDKSTCYQIKAIWGLSLGLCVLYTFSALVCIGLWRRVRSNNMGVPKPGSYPPSLA